MDRAVPAVQAIIGYNFTDHSVLWEALQAPGAYAAMPGRFISNDGHKRLALKGDAWLKLVILDDWYATKQTRAHASTVLQMITTNDHLQSICETSGISRHINLNPSSLGVVSPRAKFDTIEAIIGAAAMDGGETAVRTVMENLGLRAP